MVGDLLRVELSGDAAAALEFAFMSIDRVRMRSLTLARDDNDAAAGRAERRAGEAGRGGGESCGSVLFLGLGSGFDEPGLRKENLLAAEAEAELSAPVSRFLVGDMVRA